MISEARLPGLTIPQSPSMAAQQQVPGDGELEEPSTRVAVESMS